MSFVSVNFICIFVICLISECALSFPEAGKWEQTYYMSNVSASKEIRFPKSLYAGSEIYITVGCAPQHNEDRSIDVSWSINDLMCWNDYILTNDEPDVGNVLRKPGGSTNKKCGPQISLDRIPSEVLTETPKSLDEYQSKKANKRAASSENTISTNNTSVPTPQIDENRPKNPKCLASEEVHASGVSSSSFIAWIIWTSKCSLNHRSQASYHPFPFIVMAEGWFTETHLLQ